MRNRRLTSYWMLILWIGCFGLPTLVDAGSSMALFNLKPTSIEAMSYNGEIMYGLRNRFEQASKINLMPPREMHETLERLGLTQGANQASIRKAGIKLGVEFILFGSVSYQNERAVAELKLLKVRLNKIVGSWRFFFYGEESIQEQMPTIVDTISDVAQAQAPISSSNPAGAGGSGSKDPIRQLDLANQKASVVLTWATRAYDPVGFHVYRAQTIDGPFQLIGKTSKPRFEDTQIQKGQTYYYRIGVLLGLSEEAKSLQTAQVMNAGEKQPHPPLVLSSTGHVKRAVLKMVPSLQNQKKSFEITHYLIWRSTALEPPQWVQIAEISAKPSLPFGIETIFEDTQDLADGQRYYYAVSSRDAQNRRSPLSKPMQIQTVGIPPLRLVKDDTLRRVELAWTPVADVTGYHLYRSGNDEQWARVATIKGNQSAQHLDKKGLTDQKSYKYHLTAYDKKGQTDRSNIISAKTKDLPPVPENLTAHSGLVKSVLIEWTAVQDPDVGGYTVYRGVQPHKLSRITSVEGNPSNQYLDKGNLFAALADGQRYYYAIEAYNLFKAPSPQTPIIEATTKPRPQIPAGLTVAVDQQQVLLEWQPNPEDDIIGYEISKQTKGGFLWTHVSTTDREQNRFADPSVKPGKQYQYRIIAIDRENLKSDPALIETGPI